MNSKTDDIDNKVNVSTESDDVLLRDRLRKLEQLAKIGHWELDLVTGYLFWSEEIYNIFEIQSEEFPASYEGFLSTVHPEDREMVNEAYTKSLTDKLPYRITHRLKMQDGRVKHVEEQCETDFDSDGRPLISRGTVQDISERYEAQVREQMLSQQLYLTSKLATIGELAAGVGHEINNPLAILSGAAQQMAMVMQKREIDDPIFKKLLAYQFDAVKRIDNIVKLLRGYARTVSNQDECFEVNDSITKATGFLVAMYKTAGVDLTVNLESAGGMIKGQAGRFQQVLVNLISNSRDATEGMPEPRIALTTCLDDGYLYVEVSDNGCGIEEKNIQKIFDTFFTTKSQGKGSGLGLSISLGIIKELGGDIRVTSKVGAGSKFLMRIPLAKTIALEVLEPNIRMAVLREPNTLSGKKILLVEDEVEFRELLSKFLEGCGAEVIAVAEAQAAFDVFEETKGFDAVLTDLSMPGKNGLALAADIRLKYPEFKGKIFLMTGQTNEIQFDANIDALFTKPLNYDEILVSLADSIRSPEAA